MKKDGKFSNLPMRTSSVTEAASVAERKRKLLERIEETDVQILEQTKVIISGTTESHYINCRID